MERRFVLLDGLVRERVAKVVATLPLDPVLEVLIRPHKDKRTVEQNATMWGLLRQIAEQVEWHGLKLSADNWKDMVTASLKGQKAVPGIDGGFVVLGEHTSKMSIREMSDVIEFCYAFGAQHGVVFRDE